MLRRRRARLALVIAAGVLLLAAVERVARGWVVERLAETGAAEWIWSEDRPQALAPRAFYAVRDFELDALPGAARLEVLADEEYVLYLNGLRVGSNVYRPGAPLDVYEVAECLQVGTNRLVAELRSSRGAGGFLLELEAGDAARVVTDGSWRLFRLHHPGILGGWLAAEGGEPPRRWGTPPTGRWGALAPGPVRPLFKGLAAALRPQLPVDASPVPGLPPLFDGPWVRWDFGRVLTGYLSVEYHRGVPASALLYTGERPPVAGARPADGAIMAPRGAPSWEAARPRRLRYAVIAGPGEVIAVEVAPIPDEGEALVAPAPAGVLGIRPPPRLEPAEAEVRRQLRADGNGAGGGR